MNGGGTIQDIGRLFRDFADADPIDEHLPLHRVRHVMETRRRVGREAAFSALMLARAETKRDQETERIAAEQEAAALRQYEERLRNGTAT
jgi:DNA invertase Pin-like site-specific DNA recombinase